MGIECRGWSRHSFFQGSAAWCLHYSKMAFRECETHATGARRDFPDDFPDQKRLSPDDDVCLYAEEGKAAYGRKRAGKSLLIPRAPAAIVLGVRFEPTTLSGRAPKARAYANSATPA